LRKNITHILYHIIIVALSAGIAFSLPITAKYLVQQVRGYWSLVENEEIFLVSTEIVIAVLLIVGLNALVRDWRNRKLAGLAKTAGLSDIASPSAFLARRRMRKLKEAQGTGRSVMIIGSTGFKTFADPDGDLHTVLKNCREAKIMLLDPLKDGVTARAKSLADPEVTPERLREQIIRSIDFLKELKSLQKNIKLKLYQDVPLMKLTILGDMLSVQHYPTGLNVRKMPEYLFRHDQNASLYDLFYQYFVSRWFDSDIPEYDLQTDELIYRDSAGNEKRREHFNTILMV
jgi:hypothetical protein